MLTNISGPDSVPFSTIEDIEGGGGRVQGWQGELHQSQVQSTITRWSQR